MSNIPEVLPPESKSRDMVKRMHSLNVQMAELSKQMSREIGITGLEAVLDNLMNIIAANFDVEDLSIPVSVVKQTNLFAAVTITRLLKEMYRLENRISLTKADSPVTVEDGE